MIARQQRKGPAAGPGRGSGLSAAGWALVMALCALLITGGVNVLTRLLPPAATTPGSETAAGATGSGTASGPGVVTGAFLTPAPAPVPPPRTAALEQLTGTWTGFARTGSRRVPMTLVVTPSCAEGDACGMLSTDGPACVGHLRLEHVTAGAVFEFSITSYEPDSSPACVPHSGERFVLRDDVLAYRTDFGDGATGRLRRVR